MIDETLKSKSIEFNATIQSLIDTTTADMEKEKDALEKAKAILMATDKGDASENAPLQIARDEVAMRTSMVSLFTKRIESMADDLSTYTPNGIIQLGTTCEVTLNSVPDGLKQLDGKRFIIKLVRHDTSKANLGLVAVDTKLGNALIGRTAGELVTINAPAGSMTYQIERIY